LRTHPACPYLTLILPWVELIDFIGLGGFKGREIVSIGKACCLII
jgi:hypothetical protein